MNCERQNTTTVALLSGIAVGGNFAPGGNGSFTIASGHGGDSASAWDLVVAGSYTNVNSSLDCGSAFVGGNMTWSDPTLPPNAYVAGNFSNPTSGGSAGGTVYYGGTFSSGDTLAHTKSSPIADPIDFVCAQRRRTARSQTATTRIRFVFRRFHQI